MENSDDFVRVPKALALRLENYIYNGFEPNNQSEVYKAFKAVCDAAAAPPNAPSGEPVAFLVVGPEHRYLQWTPEVAEADAPLVKVTPLFSGDNVSTPSRYDDDPYRAAGTDNGFLTPSEHGSSAAAAGKSREGELRIIGHRIGDDGWPDEIWEGVNRCEITLHLDTGPLKDVRGHVIVNTIDGDKRGEVGDWIVTSGDGSFDVWKADIFNPLCSRLQPAAASEQSSNCEAVTPISPDPTTGGKG